MNDLLMPAMKEFTVHSLRFDHEFDYSNPYNSTDVSGYNIAFKTMTQFFNNVKVQYFTSVNAQKLKQPGDQETMQKYIRSTLGAPGREKLLQLDYNDHQEFLKYKANSK